MGFQLWDFIHYHFGVLFFYVIGVLQGIVLVVYEKRFTILITFSVILTLCIFLGIFHHTHVAERMLESVK